MAVESSGVGKTSFASGTAHADPVRRIADGTGLSREERFESLGRRGATVWLTGLPAAGKTTLSVAIERALVAEGRAAYRLDGDELRRHLCKDLGFDRAARSENVRRVAHVARLLADAGVVALVALVSPYDEDRKLARELHVELELPFVEVFVDTPIETCRDRDPKGLYARACRGDLTELTGHDDPYERPDDAELYISPGPLEPAVSRVLKALSSAGVF